MRKIVFTEKEISEIERDYLINNSDIDICVFTDNTQTMIHKIQHFLHLKKDTFKTKMSFKSLVDNVSIETIAL